MDKDRHRPWLGFALEDSLRRSLSSAKDVIAYANPEVLVSQLPPQLISELLARALASGTFSPAQVIETAPPELLAAYVEPELIWRCLKDVADRAGLSKKGASRAAPARQWLAAILQRALDSELVSPADVLRFLPPPELVSEATRAVVAELMKSALARGSFDAALVLQHLTPSVMADHLETSLVWACLADAVTRSFELGAAAARADEHAAAMSTPAPVPVAAPAPASAPAKATFKPAEKEKLFEQTVMDKSTAPAAPAKGKSAPMGTPAPTRLDGHPPRPPAAPPPKAAHGNEWRPGDDLDILDEEELPPTRARG